MKHSKFLAVMIIDNLITFGDGTAVEELLEEEAECQWLIQAFESLEELNEIDGVDYFKQYITEYDGINGNVPVITIIYNELQEAYKEMSGS